MRPQATWNDRREVSVVVVLRAVQDRVLALLLGKNPRGGVPAVSRSPAFWRSRRRVSQYANDQERAVVMGRNAGAAEIVGGGRIAPEIFSTQVSAGREVSNVPKGDQNQILPAWRFPIPEFHPKQKSRTSPSLQDSSDYSVFRFRKKSQRDSVHGNLSELAAAQQQWMRTAGVGDGQRAIGSVVNRKVSAMKRASRRAACSRRFSTASMSAGASVCSTVSSRNMPMASEP